MAVTNRVYEMNYGVQPSANTITQGATATGKDLAITISLGNSAGTTAEQASRRTAREKVNVVSQLRAMVEFIENSNWPPATS